MAAEAPQSSQGKTAEREHIVELVQNLLAKPESSSESLGEALDAMRAEDVAEALPAFGPDDRLAVFRALSDGHQEIVIEEATSRVSQGIIESLRTDELVRLIDEMPPDDAADLMLELPDSVQQEILQGVARSDPEQAEGLRELIEYPSDSAGGTMTTEFVTIPEAATAGSAIASIQGVAGEVETINTIYVTSAERRIVGVVSIRDLLIHKPDALVASFMERNVIAAQVGDERAHAAALLARYNLHALPITDARGVVRGIITVDDVIDTLQEELEEDLAMLAGTSRPENIEESTFDKGRKRLPWLLITLILELSLTVLLTNWEQLIHKLPKLAFFLPVLAAMAGSASIQASTLVVRGLASQEVRQEDLWRLVFIELRVGLLTGTVCGSLVFVFAALFAQDIRFGAVIAIGLVTGLLNATVNGTLIPLVCHRLGVDPALSSGPFITAFNDILSLAIYLSVASFLL